MYQFTEMRQTFHHWQGACNDQLLFIHVKPLSEKEKKKNDCNQCRNEVIQRPEERWTIASLPGGGDGWEKCM